MMREDIERVLPDIVSDKKAYSLQELISVAMAVNQITIRNIGNMAGVNYEGDGPGHLSIAFG